MLLQINPEMIYEAVRRLTMWKQDVPTSSILEYIMVSYITIIFSSIRYQHAQEFIDIVFKSHLILSENITKR